MTLIAMISFTLPDLIAYVLTPAAAGIFGWLKYLNSEKEKHKITETELTARHKMSVEADAKLAEQRVLAEVEKERIKSDAEVEKIKEHSIGGEAVAKIWKAFESTNADIRRLGEASQEGKQNFLLIKEALITVQQTMNKLMESIFEKIIKS